MVRAIVGGNWGDEGKGKITDLLAEDSDFVVRFQGGANAGHTIINEYGRFALHLLPSGVFRSGVVNGIGPVSYTHLAWIILTGRVRLPLLLPRLRGVQEPLHPVAGAVLGLQINLTDILPNHADGQQLQPADGPNRDDDGGDVYKRQGPENAP